MLRELGAELTAHAAPESIRHADLHMAKC